MNKKMIALILVFVSVGAFGRTRPPILDPNSCPTPYDTSVAVMAQPMSWLPADVNVSVVSTINVWNRQGREVDIQIQELVKDPRTNDVWEVFPFEHMQVVDNETPIADPNGGYNQSFTWGFTPKREGLFYLLVTAFTPSKPGWKTDQRIILVYVEGEDVPVLWVQDVPLLTMKNAQRLWQISVKEQSLFTKPTLVRLMRW